MSVAEETETKERRAVKESIPFPNPERLNILIDLVIGPNHFDGKKKYDNTEKRGDERKLAIQNKGRKVIQRFVVRDSGKISKDKVVREELRLGIGNNNDLR